MPDQTNKREGAPEPDVDERRQRLDAALNRARGQATPDQSRPSSVQGFAQALRLSSEFIAGILVGCGLGWLIDRTFDTSPWGLIVFLMLGFAAGVLNVLRSAKLVEEPMAKLRQRAGDTDLGDKRDQSGKNAPRED